MSLDAYRAVWARSKARRTDQLVLLAIADFADENGVAWPSVETLAGMVGIGRRGMQKALNRAAAAGEIIIEVRSGGRMDQDRGRPNRYRLTPGGTAVEPGSAKKAGNQRRTLEFTLEGAPTANSGVRPKNAAKGELPGHSRANSDVPQGRTKAAQGRTKAAQGRTPDPLKGEQACSPEASCEAFEAFETPKGVSSEAGGEDRARAPTTPSPHFYSHSDKLTEIRAAVGRWLPKGAWEAEEEARFADLLDEYTTDEVIRAACDCPQPFARFVREKLKVAAVYSSRRPASYNDD